MFIFPTKDKPVINDKPDCAICNYFSSSRKKIYITHIDYLKLIHGLKNSIRCVRSYAEVYLPYIRQILKTSTISFISFHIPVRSVREAYFPSFKT